MDEYLEAFRESRFRDADETRHKMAGEVSAEADRAPLEAMLHGHQTAPLPALWFEFADALAIAPREAARLVEKFHHSMTPAHTYARAEIGLFAPMRTLGVRLHHAAFDSCGMRYWDRDWCLEQWDFVRLSAQDAESLRRRVGASGAQAQGQQAEAMTTAEWDHFRLSNAERGARDAGDEVLEATQDAPIEMMLMAAATVPLPRLWFDLADSLDVSPKQAADLIERIIKMKPPQFPLYGVARGGLYARLSGEVAAGVCLDVWNAANDADWEREWCCERLDFLALAAKDAKALRETVEAIGTQAAPAESLEPVNAKRWPWGAHETVLLRHLAAAAEKWWANFDPTDNTTAPTNEQVSEWLKARGVAARTAEVMATILRADGLPTGPRT